jgi:hypothetical protein
VTHERGSSISEVGNLLMVAFIGGVVALALSAPPVLIGGFAEGFALGRLVRPRNVALSSWSERHERALWTASDDLRT